MPRGGSTKQTHCRRGHEFNELNTYTDGVGKRHCRPCRRLRSAARGDDRRRKYGITPEDYERMVEEQGGKCACCGDETEVFDVDHNHKTKRVRALLCHSCNVAIGYAREDPVRLLKAAIYIDDQHTIDRIFCA